MSKPTLYSYWMSSCSWRARMVLAFKNIEYELKTVDLGKDEQHSEWYLKLNPLGFVPTFMYNGNVICESMAIMEYLEEEFPESKLLPGDSINRSLIRSICMNVISGIQPLQVPRMYEHVSKSEEEQLKFVRNVINTGLSAIEKRLKTCAGKFCVGNEITLADICVIPQVYNAMDKFGMDISQYETIARVYKTVNEMEFVQKSHPTKQPDYPH